MADYPDLPPEPSEPPVADGDTPIVPQDPAPRRAVVLFDELTLAEALHYFFWRPGKTARLFWQVLVRDEWDGPRDDYGPADGPLDTFAPERDEPSLVRYEYDAADGELDRRMPLAVTSAEPAAAAYVQRWLLRVLVLAVAALLAIRGGQVLYGGDDAGGATLWFAAASALYLGYETAAGRAWWARRFPNAVRRLRGIGGGEDAPAALNAAFVIVAVVALWLGVVLPGLPLLSAGLLTLAGGLWLIFVLRAFPPAPGDGPALEPPEVVQSETVVQDSAARGFWVWFHAHVYQLVLLPIALLFSAFAFIYNVERGPDGGITDVVLTPFGFAAWVIGVVLWIGALSLDRRALVARQRAGSRRRPAWDRLRGLRPGWPALALAGIVALGAFIRLHDLASTPPEMTSDHIEKLLDSLRVGQGHFGVFFPNNGGREGFQMYLVAAIAELGAGYSFTALKLATVLEGVVTLPLLWWMARQVIGTDTESRRRFGNWVGLALAALVAVSSWHLMLSRLGLRIVLTPLAATLVIGFLARAMRHNRLGDWIALGLSLGAGIYFYQADRMLPMVVAIGAVLALLARVRSGRDLLRFARDGAGVLALAGGPLLAYMSVAALLHGASGADAQEAGDRMSAFLPMVAMLWLAVVVLALRSRHLVRGVVFSTSGGLFAAAVIALAVAVPMLRYGDLFPENFWNRTRGRMFGEMAFVRVDETTGATALYDPGISEQFERFWDQRDVFVDNYRDALRMFHWQGDEMWITNADRKPALDAITGGLAILGGVMLAVWLVRRRDPVAGLIPFAVLVMLLPSAMTLAYVNENPSFTRASGTIPTVYFLAALPVGALCYGLTRLFERERAMATARVVLALAVIALVAGAALPGNWDNFFHDYRLSYAYSWKPYHAIAAPLRTFAEGEGSYGNAFMVAYPHWLDHRILGTVAGDIGWPNGLVQREDLIPRILTNQGTAYAFDPSRPVFIMFNAADPETADYLETLIPGGQVETYTYTYDTSHGVQEGDYLIYRAPGSALDVAR